MVRRVAQSLPQLVDRRVETLFEIDESRAAPQVTLQLLTTDDLARPAHQKRKDL